MELALKFGLDELEQVTVKNTRNHRLKRKVTEFSVSEGLFQFLSLMLIQLLHKRFAEK